MTPEQARDEAGRGELRPIYLILGEERYLRQQVVQTLRTATLKDGFAGLNEEQLTAGDADVGRVLLAARTLPMMAKRRWVLVKQVERWETQDQAEVDTAFRQLYTYAEAPALSSVLVLVADKLDQRRKFVAYAKKQGFLVSCEALGPARLPAWVSREVARRGHRLSIPVAELIAELSGPDLSAVDDAIERLSLYVGSGQEITQEAVAVCLTALKPRTVWELVNAVGRRQTGEALAVLARVFDSRDRGLKLLGVLAWSTRQLLRFRAATARGLNPPEAAQAAGAPPFKAAELAKQVAALRSADLEHWLTILAETDLALKGGSKRPPRAILEDVLIRLCTR